MKINQWIFSILFFCIFDAVSAEESFPLIIDSNIEISTAQQKLYLFVEHELAQIYDISTSRFGIGNNAGSFRTPLGRHNIFQKIGAGELVGRVFWGRNPMPLVVPIVSSRPTKKDSRYITTRILWLEGREDGINKGGIVDTKNRFIYIHGTNMEGAIGSPDSFGCVYMKNQDIIELFDIVAVGTLVVIR